MEIPDYIIRALIPRIKIVATRCRAPGADPPTSNALRLLRKDAATLQKLLDKQTQTQPK